MKKVLTVMMLLLLIAASPSVQSQAQQWWWRALTNRTLAWVNVSGLDDAQRLALQFTFVSSAESRLDSALAEWKAKDPCHFAEVMNKYGLQFNAEIVTVIPGTPDFLPPCQ